MYIPLGTNVIVYENSVNLKFDAFTFYKCNPIDFFKLIEDYKKNFPLRQTHISLFNENKYLIYYNYTKIQIREKILTVEYTNNYLYFRIIPFNFDS